MMKSEFEERIGKQVKDGEYPIIEFVYTWHPSIDNVKGKDQIAKIYTDFGMKFIRGMVPGALLHKRYEDKKDEIIGRKVEAMKPFDAELAALEDEYKRNAGVPVSVCVDPSLAVG